MNLSQPSCSTCKQPTGLRYGRWSAAVALAHFWGMCRVYRLNKFASLYNSLDQNRWWGFGFPARITQIFIKLVQTVCGTHPAPFQCVPGVLLSEIIQAGRKIQDSTPYTVQVRNEWSYTSTHPTCLYDMHNSNFTFYTENVRTSIYSQPLIAPQIYASKCNLIWIF